MATSSPQRSPGSSPVDSPQAASAPTAPYDPYASDMEPVYTPAQPPQASEPAAPPTPEPTRDPYAAVEPSPVPVEEIKAVTYHSSDEIVEEETAALSIALSNAGSPSSGGASPNVPRSPAYASPHYARNAIIEEKDGEENDGEELLTTTTSQYDMSLNGGPSYTSGSTAFSGAAPSGGGAGGADPARHRNKFPSAPAVVADPAHHYAASQPLPNGREVSDRRRYQAPSSKHIISKFTAADKYGHENIDTPDFLSTPWAKPSRERVRAMTGGGGAVNTSAVPVCVLSWGLGAS